MEILERYRREAPEVFARLPLPNKLAEELGVPYSEEVVHLNDYLKAFLKTRGAPIDAVEEKVAVELLNPEDPDFESKKIKFEVPEIIPVPKPGEEGNTTEQPPVIVIEKPKKMSADDVMSFINQSASEHPPTTLDELANSRESSGTKSQQ
jgi:hypothetical protein